MSRWAPRAFQGRLVDVAGSVCGPAVRRPAGRAARAQGRAAAACRRRRQVRHRQTGRATRKARATPSWPRRRGRGRRRAGTRVVQGDREQHRDARTLASAWIAVWIRSEAGVGVGDPMEGCRLQTGESESERRARTGSAGRRSVGSCRPRQTAEQPMPTARPGRPRRAWPWLRSPWPAGNAERWPPRTRRRTAGRPGRRGSASSRARLQVQGQQQEDRRITPIMNTAATFALTGSGWRRSAAAPAAPGHATRRRRRREGRPAEQCGEDRRIRPSHPDGGQQAVDGSGGPRSPAWRRVRRGGEGARSREPCGQIERGVAHAASATGG